MIGSNKGVRKVTAGVEKVLRLHIEDPATLSRIMQEFTALEGFEATPISRKEIGEVYYDTASGDLLAAGFSYCLREDETGASAILSQFKRRRRLNFIQEQWEKKVAIEKPLDGNLRADTCFSAAKLEKIIGAAELIPLFSSSCTRTKLNLLSGAETWLEITGDQGELTIKGVKKPLLQLQLKQKKGSVQELLKLAAVIIGKYHLLIDSLNCCEQAMAGLAPGGKQRAPVVRVKIAARHRTADTAECILEMAINAVFDSYIFLLQHLEDPESTHQIRVRIRKLRAVLAFFEPLFEPEKYQQLQERLREAGLAFAELRQVDVLLEEIAKMEKDSLLPGNALDRLTETLRADRQTAMTALAAYLQQGDITLLVLEVWIWLLDAPWAPSEALAEPVGLYTEKALTEWRKRINRRIKKIDLADPVNIHKVRIRSKKLRYITEQLAPLLDRKSRSALKKYEQLQDDLGYFHDVYGNREWLAQLLAQSEDKQLHYEAGLVVGWQTLQGKLKMEKYLR
jgi:CHAD domain-containing protein